jgi:O-antigen/teichoic acid export membrane protein
MFVLFVILSTLLLFFRHEVNEYVGFPAAGFLILMLGASLGVNAVTSLLDGRHLVHISGLLSPIRTGGRATLQIGALSVGLGIAGLFGGYILGYLLVVLLGVVVISRNIETVTKPTRNNLKNLFSYAKYAWLGALQSTAFNRVDIAVLGFFVPQSFIGFYSASWNIAQFLILFGGSLSRTLFPEMSKISEGRNSQAVSSLVHSALSYAGLMLIPGLIGGTILGDRILRIYGPDFEQATVVLSILISACLLQAYQAQLTNTLNAINRPDLSFRINAVFIVANVVLNVILIYFHGWVGAAVATAVSVAISLIVGYVTLSPIVQFSIPFGEIGRQWLAAILMGIVVYTGLRIESTYLHIGHNLAIVFTLVTLGAGVYFLALLAISTRFRTAVVNNLPARFTASF